MTVRYRYNKKWRQSHPGAHSRQTKRYYRKHGGGKNSRKFWSEEDKLLITSHKRPCDVVLSALLGRSVKAIQLKRAKLRKENQI